MYCNLCTRCIFNKNVVCMYEVNYLKSALNVVAIIAGWMLLLPLPLSLLLCILLLFLSTHIIHSLKLLVADVFSVSAFFFFFFTSLCSARCALYSVYKTIISNCGVHSRTLSEPWARFTVRHRHPWSFFSFITAVFSSLLLSASSMSVISYFVAKVVSRLAWLVVCVSGLALAR